MRRLLDAILVVDVESTCWPHESRRPPGEWQEIIEIGVAVLATPTRIATTGEVITAASCMVKPMHSRVSAFCTELTGITQEEADTGRPFDDVAREIVRTYEPHSRVWASWGDYDRRMFREHHERFGDTYPWGETHLNAKALFALRFGLPKELGMAEALAMAGIPLEGRHHRAGDDAKNIAKLLGLALWGGW